MKDDKEKISLDKYLLIKTLLEKKECKRLFSDYDERLIRKKFADTRELSITENILTLDAINLTPKDVKSIVNNFIKKANSPLLLRKSNLYELIKVSNIKALKINKNLSEKTLITLGENLKNLFNKTKLISFDFVILRALDNFILKINNPIIKNSYNAIKKDLLRKMLSFSYEKEIREKQVTYFCWIDRLLVAILKNEISLYEFMELNIKILKLIPNHLDACWKVLQTASFLCFQPSYSDSNKIRKFRRDVSKIIKNKYNDAVFSKDSVVELMINTLAREKTFKEDFYYLFDAIKLLSQKSEEDKLFCFELCEYVLHVNERQNIFCYRFIREYFLNILNEVIKEEDSLGLKDKEFSLLVSLFHEQSFFILHQSELFEKLVKIVASFNNEKVTKNKFYKYCDMLDFMLSNNPNIKHPGLINFLSIKQGDNLKISKRFELSRAAFLV